VFKEVQLANLFKKNYRDEGFYSGEEAYLTDNEHSESVRIEEPRREELETSRTVQTIEVSTGTLPVVSAALRNESNLSHQRTATSSPSHTQSGNLGRYMADEMRLPTFRGDGSEDPEQYWFLYEVVWSIKNITNEAVKRA
jgi:hypothetical protein